MPFKNEHSVRVTQPSKTRYSRFRRQNNAFGNGVHAIWGILKRSIGNAHTELQALRFDSKKYTIESVKRWIKEHGGSGMGLKIEPAYDHRHVGEVYEGNPKVTEKEIDAFIKKEKIGQGIVKFNPNRKAIAELLLYRKQMKRNPMNTDELFNYYVEEMAKVDPREAKKLETGMSQMLEMRVTPSVVWNYAKKSIASVKKYKRNPMKPQDVAAWLEAAYHEEKQGIKQYERLLEIIKGVPEYSHERTIVKKILRDERRHLKMLEKYVVR